MFYQIDFVRYYNFDPRELLVFRNTDTKWSSSQVVILESLDLRDNYHYFFIIDILKMNFNTDYNENCQTVFI